MRILSLPIVVTLLVCTLSGCSKKGQRSSTKGNSQAITVNLYADPQTLDPRKVRSLMDTNLVKLFMDGLTRISPQGEILLSVAESVELSSDKKRYTFTLRSSSWSNGDPVTAQDFSYAWKKSLSPNFPAPNAYLLYLIQNGEEVKRGKLPSSLLGVETPDARTLVVTLKHPAPYFLELLSHPSFFPINSRLDRTDDQWYLREESYVGNGPFTLQKWKPHYKLTAKKNESYWDHSSVSLSQIDLQIADESLGLQLFEKKQTQWVGPPFSLLPLDAIDTLRKKQLLTHSPYLGSTFIRINIDSPPFHLKEMRKAFAYAINREEIANYALEGEKSGATKLVPFSMELQTPSFQDCSIEEGQQLFQKGVNLLGYSLEAFPHITLLYPNKEVSHIIAHALQDQWCKHFGIPVQLEGVTPDIFFNRLSKTEYTLALSDWFADFNDPITFLEIFKAKDNGTNNTNWEHSNYTKLISEATQAVGKEKRIELLRESETLLIEEMPIIPLFYSLASSVKDDKIKNISLTAMGNLDFKWAYLEASPLTEGERL